MAKRRTRGEGSIYQRHDHPDCPPATEAGERPDHRCRGRWVGVINLGSEGNTRKRRTFYGDTQRIVRMKIAEAKEQQSQGVALARQPSVEAWLRHWLDVICVERGLKVNTLKSHRSKVEQYLIPHLGRHRLDRLEPAHVRDMHAALHQRGLADSTIRQTHVILSRALVVAVRERRIGYNVAKMMDTPQVAIEADRQALALADARRILERNELRWWTAVYLGLRQGEALALRWSDVDLERGVLRVERSLARQPGAGLVATTPKTKGSVRDVPLPPLALARFKLAAGAGATGLVFPSTAGGFRDHRRDWQDWRDLLNELGIPHVPLHAARHTAATLLDASGVPINRVGQILGQRSLMVTSGYQHIDVEELRAALGRYGDLLALPE